MIIGLDMGGTHVDAVIIKDGTIVKATKKPIDKENLFESIWSTLEDLLLEIDVNEINQINLSTTVSTNAIVEKNISPVAMFIQSGPGLPEEFLKRGDESIFLSGYIDHRGRVIKDLNITEIKGFMKSLKERNIHACGVVTKFSTRNPNFEIQIKDLLEKEQFSPITMGHTISGNLNFPRRINTTYLNSAVHETFNQFSKNIEKAMNKKGIGHIPLNILKADGGTMNMKTATKNPIETILSGPAASLMGMNAMLNTDEDAILLDIGGTTTDIFFLADGVPLFEPLGIKIDQYKTLVRSIYSQSIGLGGDSHITIDRDRLKIGPERKGPPMAFGGDYPTPTDAMIVLGYIKDGNKAISYKGMKVLGDQLNLNEIEISKVILNKMAKKIHHKVQELLAEINSQPVYTVKEFLEDRQIKPKLINMIGGPAKALSSIVEKEFKLPCHYPKKYDIANAVGAALAKTTTEITLEADTSQKTLSVPELGIYEDVHKNFTLEMAKDKALKLLINHAKSLGANEKEIEVEITEESSFNMVRGFFTSGKILRIKAQVQPGLVQKLGGFDIDA